MLLRGETCNVYIHSNRTHILRQSAIKVDKNKFLAVALCTRKEFQSIVDIMMEYNPSDNGKMILCRA